MNFCDENESRKVGTWMEEKNPNDSSVELLNKKQA